MKEIRKVPLSLPLISTVGTFIAIVMIGLPGPKSTSSVIAISLMIIFSFLQWPIYFKYYIDYRFQELEKINQKCEIASSPNENVS